jgi:hypothetical protein
MKTFRSTLRRLFGGEARRPAPRRPRPALEGLEERWCPATFYWHGDVSSSFTNAANWRQDNGLMWFRPPDSGDTVIFDGGRSNNSCDYSVALSSDKALCASLLVHNGYGGDISLSTNSTAFALTIAGDLRLEGAAGSDLRLGAGNKLAVGGGLYWHSGGVDREDMSALATVSAHHVHLSGAGDKYLGANLKTTGPGGASVINLDHNPAAGGDSVLHLDKGAVLENGAGTLTHDRGTIDDTAHPEHERSFVRNAAGATWRKATDTLTKVSMTFVNDGAVRLEAGAYLIDDFSSAGYSAGYHQGPTGTTVILPGAALLSLTGEQHHFATADLDAIAASLLGESEPAPAPAGDTAMDSTDDDAEATEPEVSVVGTPAAAADWSVMPVLSPDGTSESEALSVADDGAFDSDRLRS